VRKQSQFIEQFRAFFPNQQLEVSRITGTKPPDLPRIEVEKTNPLSATISGYFSDRGPRSGGKLPNEAK